MAYKRNTYYRNNRPQMTAEEAVKFERYSESNVQLIGAAIRLRAENSGKHAGCQCVAYQDIFTYDRWKALGFQVQRGETKLVTVTTWREKKDDAGNVVGKFPWHSALFCRCQVQAKDDAGKPTYTGTYKPGLSEPVDVSPMLDGVPEDIAMKVLEAQAEREQEEQAFLSDPDYRLGGKFSSLEL